MRKYKREMINNARSLGYMRVMPDIEQRILEAATESEVIRIMITARHLMPR